jgi:hypothetical protein
MSTALDTIATGRQNPGSFYGRGGRVPVAERDAAWAVTQASSRLLAALKAADPDMPLDGCLSPAEGIRRTARILTGCLTREGALAGHALTPDLSIPPPSAAGQAAAHLGYAARHAGAAGSSAFTAWRTLRSLSRDTAGTDSGPGPLGKAAADAATAAAELGAQFRKAQQGHIPAALPMIEGHARVTGYLALALIDLCSSCGALADAVRTAAPRTARAENRVTGPLRDAGEAFRLAGTAAQSASGVLDDAAGIIRKAPPGYPCAECGGTTISRLTRSACGSCRGGGVGVRAMRPVTDY